jgi:tellurite resistance protein/voltage-gated potassium channel Kch
VVVVNNGSEDYPRRASGSGGGGICCLIFLVIVVLLVLFVVLPRLTAKATTTVAMRENVAAPQGRSMEDILAELHQRDPQFEPMAFLQRSRTIFVTVQEAWFERNLESARSLMSDGVLRKFTAQQALMKKEGVRNAVAGMKVLDVRILDVATTEFFQVLDVAIEASARDTDIPWSTPDAQARALAGRQPEQRFTEIWTFARKPNAKTKKGQTVIEGKCPNCGADYPGGPSAQCEFCGAVVNSGHHDWVLLEITQAEEHELLRSMSDFGGMLSKDPGFDPFSVEDRASLVFWRLLQARATNDVGLLPAICGGEALQQQTQKIQERAAKDQRLSYHQAAVGACQLLDLDVGVPGRKPGELLDLAHVKLNWSARIAIVGLTEQGRFAQGFTSRSTVLVLARKSDAKTPPNRGLATSRCGHCGAPVPNDAAAVCESCSTPLGASKTDWVLQDELTLEQWQAQHRSKPRVQAKSRQQDLSMGAERRRMLQSMCAMAWADGVIEPRERQLLHDLADRWQISRYEVDQLLDAGAPVELDLPAPGSDEAGEFMANLVAMAMADGRMDRQERALIQYAAEQLQVPQGDLEALIQAHRG